MVVNYRIGENMNCNFKYSLLVFTSCLLLGFSVADLNAQQASGSGASSGGLVEVIVTARRREEGLMSMPVSITAFTSNDIEMRQFDRVSRITEATPNLHYRTGIEGLNNAALVFIRGIGQGDFVPTLQAGVGYLDASYKELEANVSFPATNSLPNIPEWTTNASAVLRIPLTGSVGGEVEHPLGIHG